jgi:hypothetical protein
MKQVTARLKSLLWLSSFLSLSQFSAQITNYVTNGGFEKYTTCNVNDPLMTYAVNAIGWDEIDNNMSTKWNNYCYGSVPFNAFYYCYPRTDSAYVAYDFLCLNCSQNTLRTYIRNTLKEKLNAGKTYCVKFYINNSEYSSYSIDGFDAYFGGNELDTITRAHIPLTYLTPQIKNPTNNFITDTIGWSLITGTFTANGSEKYMVIGNLRSDALTNKILSNLSLASQSYSFCTAGIDDVSCIPIDLPAFAGEDTSCAPGTSKYLGRQRDVGIDEDCMWYKLPNVTTAIDTAAGIWVKPVVTTTYVVRQEICGYVKWDTVVVFMNLVGLEKLKILNEELQIYPVPARDFIELKISNRSLFEGFNSIALYNNLGQLIKEEEISCKEEKLIITTNDFNPGIYVLKIKSKTYGTVSKRFVISR